VRALENGSVTRPQAASLNRLAAALGVDPASLLPRVPSSAGPDAGPDAGQSAGPDAGPDEGPLRVDVLGPLAVRRGRTVIAVASPMHRKLLGLLGLQPHREVGYDEIIDALWEGAPPRTCRELVHTYVSGLRRVLGGGRQESVLSRSPQGYRLLLSAGQSDAAEFGELVTRAERAAAEGAALPAWQLYTEAMACWRGPLLAGAGAWTQVQPAAIALAGQRTAAVLAWAELGLSLGSYGPLIPTLRMLAVEQPLHEGLAARLMLALAGAGQQAEALAVYEELRAQLGGQLGIDPGPELSAAHLRVLRGQLPGSAVGVGSGALDSAPPAQLPTDCATFTGRDGELAILDRLLTPEETTVKAAPVAVVTGMAGVGKTALAIRWAQRERGRYPDGQLYADLRGHAPAGPARPLEVLGGFLAALGERTERIPEDEGQAAALLRTRLAGKRVLILLDNALDARQVRPLLPAAPGSAAIVTARDRLAGLVARDGAGSLAVRPLGEREATALLAAAMGDRGAAEAPTDLAELAGLCAHLPLALRIAAANLATRPGYHLADYVARLVSGDRLTGLAVPEDPDAAVRSTFEVSCDALKPEVRRVFRLAGLAPGPDLTAPAMAALAGIATRQAESLLDRLAAHSLVDEYVPGRYRLHDLLRLYAAELAEAEERAADREAALDRLAAYAIAAVRSAAELLYPHLLHLPDDDGLAADGATGLAGGEAGFADGAAALAWLDAEHANLVALVARLAERRREAAALRIADRLAGYFFMRSNTVDWLVAATAARDAAAASDDPAAAAAAEIQLGMLRIRQSRNEAAAEHFAAAARRAREAGWLAAEAVAVNNLASAYWAAGRPGDTVERLTEALDLHRRSGRKAGEAVTLANLAAARLELARSTEADSGRTAADQHRNEALRLLAQARDMHEALGDQRNEAETCRLLAEAHRDLGRPAPAAEHARRAVELASEAADLRFEITARSTLATVLVWLGESGPGLAEHARARDLARQADDPRQQVVALLDLADSLVRLGRGDEALLQAQDASAAAGRLGLPLLQRRAQRLLGGTT
jgi:DNA-binding SARP family transcriptional activator